MRQEEGFDEFESNFERKQFIESGLSINYHRIVGRAKKYWFVFPITLLIGLGVAFIVNKYSSVTYTTQASIIIKESEENAGVKFLYNNSLVNQYRNFFNEMYIMKSYPLMEEVIRDLNFMVTITSPGEIKATEVYPPNVIIQVIEDSISSLPWGNEFQLKVLDQKRFQLQIDSDSEVSNDNEPFYFGDTISIEGFKFNIRKRNTSRSLVENKNYLVSFTNPFTLARLYSRRLIISWAEEGASVVNLRLSGNVKRKDVDFLHSFKEIYSQQDALKKNERVSKSVNFLEDQMTKMYDSLRFFENEILEFKVDNLLADEGQEATRLYEQLQVYELNEIQFQLEKEYFEYLKTALDREDIEAPIVTPASVGLEDPVIVSLVTQVIQLQSILYSEGGDERMGNNPLYLEKRKAIPLLRQDIIEAIENYEDAQKITRKFNAEQIKILENKLKKVPGMEQDLSEIRRNYNFRENLYSFLQQKRAEAEIAKASVPSDIIWVNEPYVASTAVKPSPVITFIIGTLAAVIVPFIVFFLMELLNNKVQSKDDIEQLSNIPVIGGVGHSKDDETLVVMKRPQSIIAESFRTLRSNLSYYTGGDSGKVFMITSSLSGEGKSFTTLNIASVLAISGKSVLIIGADLRRPKLYADLGCNNEHGLSEVLSGLSDFESAVQITSYEGIHLLSGGPIPPNPSELLLKESVKDLIEQLKEKYDYLVMDTPPLGLVTDPLVLSKYADHVVFLVRQNYTPRNVFGNINDLYASGRTRNVSILFNDIRKSGPGYGYGYGHGYGYGYSYKGKSHEYYSEG